MAGLHEDALYAGLAPFAPPKPCLSFAGHGKQTPSLPIAAETGFLRPFGMARESLFCALTGAGSAAVRDRRNGGGAGFFGRESEGAKIRHGKGNGKGADGRKEARDGGGFGREARGGFGGRGDGFALTGMGLDGRRNLAAREWRRDRSFLRGRPLLCAGDALFCAGHNLKFPLQK